MFCRFAYVSERKIQQKVKFSFTASVVEDGLFCVESGWEVGGSAWVMGALVRACWLDFMMWEEGTVVGDIRRLCAVMRDKEVKGYVLQ